MTQEQHNSARSKFAKLDYVTEHTLFKTYKNKYNISKDVFLLIVKTFFVALNDSILKTGTVYKLPFGTGYFGVMKRQLLDAKVFDFQHYKETNEKRYLTNNHSEKFVARIKWVTLKGYSGGVPKEFRNVFTFSPVRANKRQLAKLIKTNSIYKYYDDEF